MFSGQKLHVHNFRSSLRVATIDVDDTSHLTATLLQEIPGNVPWYMTDSIAVLEDGYSEVGLNVMAVAFKSGSFSRRCRETTHDDHEQYWRRLYFCNCEHEPWQCHNT